MKVLLFLCMIVTTAFAGAVEPTASKSDDHPPVQGVVLEVQNVPQFTYLLLKTSAGESWAAVVTAEVKKGETVTIENSVVMENFESKSLKRTFKKILFGNLRGAGNKAAGSSTLGKSFAIAPGQMPQPPVAEHVAKATGENAMTVAEIVAKPASLKGKTVRVRGKVVKYNPEIMGKNWVHLQDGSGTAQDGTDDILVTTADKASVGDIVTAQGTVNTDQDFGAGYSYKVLIEGATLQK